MEKRFGCKYLKLIFERVLFSFKGGEKTLNTSTKSHGRTVTFSSFSLFFKSPDWYF